MPSTAVHLTIAHSAAEMLGICDMPAFCLGNIAPDAVNAEGFAPAAERYAAHIRSRSYAEWKERISGYRAAHGTDDFTAGVLLHLYTDIAWDEVVQPLLFDHLRGRGFGEDELNRQKWAELSALDARLVREQPYREAAAALAKAVPQPATTVTAEQIARWREVVLAYEPENAEPEFLNEEHIARALARAIQLYKGN